MHFPITNITIFHFMIIIENNFIIHEREVAKNYLLWESNRLSMTLVNSSFVSYMEEEVRSWFAQDQPGGKLSLISKLGLIIYHKYPIIS